MLISYMLYGNGKCKKEKKTFSWFMVPGPGPWSLAPGGLGSGVLTFAHVLAQGPRGLREMGAGA